MRERCGAVSSAADWQQIEAQVWQEAELRDQLVTALTALTAHLVPKREPALQLDRVAERVARARANQLAQAPHVTHAMRAPPLPAGIS